MAELRRPGADFRRFVTHRIGAIAKPVGDAAQRRSYSLPDVAGGLHGPYGGAAAGTFQVLWAQDRPASVGGASYVRDAHSLYLEALSELGIAGLLLLAVTPTGRLNCPPYVSLP